MSDPYNHNGFERTDRFTVECPEDLRQAPDLNAAASRADLARDAGPCRAFAHTPVSHGELASTLNRMLADAAAASLAAAESARVRGDIAQREVAPGSGVYSLTRGRVVA